jgi:two-component system chemotaxis sensor kinase CheA
MNSDEVAQYKDLFVTTAKKYLETLNMGLLKLEKEPTSKEVINEIFRAAHSLKGQSAAMGFKETGYLCHVVEDVFYEIKENGKKVDPALADLLFASLDALTASIQKIEAEGVEQGDEALIENLKKASGVATIGAGKTEHLQKNEEQATAPLVEAATPARKLEIKEKTTAAPPRPEYKETEPLKLSIKTIPVKVEQLDTIVESLEELMVDRLTMQTLLKDLDDPLLSQAQDKLDKIIEVIRFQIMKIRTVPLSMVFDHFPRTVRDIGRMLNKEIELKIEGGDLELDRTIVERLDEPLTHLVRNAADHGIKSRGTITITARADRDFAIVEVKDNGDGINWEAVAKKAGVASNDQIGLRKALFSGISTAGEVSIISGRGIGLEVVKRTIEEFGGSIDIVTAKGQGTTFILKLPLMVSVVKTLIVHIGSQDYALVAAGVEISLKISDIEIVNSAGQEAFRYKDQEIPIVRFNYAESHGDSTKNAYLVILNIDGEKIALAVDRIVSAIETVIKPLPKLIKDVDYFSGVTIIGDGRSILLINPRSFIQ